MGIEAVADRMAAGEGLVRRHTSVAVLRALSDCSADWQSTSLVAKNRMSNVEPLEVGVGEDRG